MRVSVRAIVFTVLVIIFQIIFFVLYITLTDYGPCGFPEWITNVSYTLNSSLFSSKSDSTDTTDITTDTTTAASITVTTTSDTLSTTITDTSTTDTTGTTTTDTTGTTTTDTTGITTTDTASTTTTETTATATTDTTGTTTTDTTETTTTDTTETTTTDTTETTTTDTTETTTTDTTETTAEVTTTNGATIAPLKFKPVRNKELVIKYAHHPSPRFFLPPGSHIPPLSTDPTKGPFYSTLPISVMIFAGLGLLFSAIRCNSFTGLGLTFFLACFAFEWAALVVPWLLQAAVGTFKPEEIYYNITTILDILYAVFSMIVAFGALAGRASRVQLLVVVIFGVVLYAVTRMVIVHYLVVLDLAGSMSVFTFGAFYGVAISWVINAFYKSDSMSHNNRKNYLYTGYVENLLSLLGSILIFVHWPYYCAYLIPVTMDMYIRAIVNTYFSMVSCVVMVYALSSVMTKSKRIDIGHIQKATLGGGVAVASVAPLYLHIWGAVLLGVLTAIFSIIFLNYIQRHTHKRYIYDSYSVMSAFGIPGIIGGIASAVMAALAVSPLDYTLNELFILYPAITGPNGVGAPRSDTIQGAYQFAGLLVAIGIGLVGGLLVGIIVRYLGPLEEDEAYTDDTMFTFPYETGNPCCPPPTKCEKACKNAKD